MLDDTPPPTPSPVPQFIRQLGVSSYDNGDDAVNNLIVSSTTTTAKEVATAARARHRPRDSEDTSDEVNASWSKEDEQVEEVVDRTRKRRRRDDEALWSDDDCSSTHCYCTPPSPPLPRQRQTTGTVLEDNIALVASRALARLASKSSNLIMIMPSASCMCYSCRAPPPPVPHPAQQAYHQQAFPPPPPNVQDDRFRHHACVLLSPSGTSSLYGRRQTCRVWLKTFFVCVQYTWVKKKRQYFFLIKKTLFEKRLCVSVYIIKNNQKIWEVWLGFFCSFFPHHHVC